MYVIEIGVLDDHERCIVDNSANDTYISLIDASNAYEALTREYVYNFLKQDLGVDESDVGIYKKLIGEDLNIIHQTRWFFDE